METQQAHLIMQRNAALEKEVAVKSRELEIEAALEKVRAKAMAMQTSEELKLLVGTVFTELTKLDILLIGCVIMIFDFETNDSRWWMVNTEAPLEPLSFFIKYHEHPPYLQFVRAWKERTLKWEYRLEGSIKKEWDEFLFNETELALVPEEVKAGMVGLEHILLSTSFNNFGCLNLGTTDSLNEQQFGILLRFAKVFELTYTRFNDLKKAEAQTREAKIEAALERVRSRSMAMHHSDELDNVVKTLGEELVDLGISLDGAAIFFFDKEKKSFHLRIATTHLPAPLKVNMPYEEDIQANEIIRNLWEAIETEGDFINKSYSGKVKDDYFRFVGKHNALTIPEEVRKLQLDAESWTFSFTGGKNSVVGIDSWSGKVTTFDEFQVLKRFAKVFEQVYTRFQDLQKAEAQAREAHIELGLERVRARAMAMHSSTELREVVRVLFEKLREMDFVFEDGAVSILVFKEGSRDHSQWSAGPGSDYATAFEVPYTGHSICSSLIGARESGVDFFSKIFPVEQKNDYFQYLFDHTNYRDLPDVIKELILGSKQYGYSVAFGEKSAILIPTNSGRLVPQDKKETLKRFANVFDQAFIRFLDLQKAEAQTREAQIELALERVRARTMAMQKSNELAKAAELLYYEFGKLGINTFTCGYLFINEIKNIQTGWVVLPDGTLLPDFIDFPLSGDIVLDNRYKAWKEKQPLHVCELEGEANKKHHSFLAEHVPSNVADDFFSQIPDPVFFYCANFSDGYLFIVASKVFSPDEEQTIVRFAKVFEMTYTRFLDLKKAEAQAREAKIEAAMENIRARSLAMNHSDELKDVALVLFKKLDELKVAHNTIAIQLFDFETKDSIFWPGNLLQDEPPKVRLPYDEKMMKEDTCHKDLWDAMSTGEIIFNKVYNKHQKDRWFQYVFANNDTNVIHPHAREFILNAEIHTVCFIPEKNSALFSDSWDGSFYTEEELNVLTRAAKVFEQAYIRFLDLQKAEAQAREAKIETALERVRSRSLAMHSSNELKDIIAILFEKLVDLNVLLGTVAIQLFDQKSMHSYFWIGNAIQDPQMVYLPHDKLMMVEDTFLKDGWQAMAEGKDIVNKEYTVEQKNKFFDYVFANNDFTQIPETAREVLRQMQSHIICFMAERNSALFADSWNQQLYSQESLRVLKRAARVFEQAYIRFLDLQKAEAQAREAKIEAAMERLRSKAMAMQTTSELHNVIQTMYEELKKLDESLNRCFIMIFDIQTHGATWWMAGDDVTATSNAYCIPYSQHPPHLAYLSGWQEQQEKWQYTMEGRAKKDWDNFLFHQTDLAKLPGVVIDFMKSFEKIYLNASFKSFGCLTTGSVEPLSEEAFKILIRFTNVFDLSYTRFNDLKQAEQLAAKAEQDLVLLKQEKKRTEEALQELKATQAQLIQSEKMASLGELTAGIAHEIQNPLNFVNNFSEVNTELIKELEQEIDDGNYGDAKAIAKDIKDNEQKINHHGKRADSIVKGMLQHSRSNIGQKAPTDINKLADEYLRLAFHGLRAKDKSFNATLKTDYDESIGTINIIPQDIGRVILNLITNAFHAVNEKKQQQEGYEPIVTVRTNKIGGNVLIIVKDNGNGIPTKVVDKIFQPFFTTKPTGQGTGLGLSLSYDIVKAHGGEIKVETSDGNGSAFIIHLPIT